MAKTVVIIGALGKDFHTFNTCFRDNTEYKVVAFTFAEEQNLGTTKEAKELKYPSALSGANYPEGVKMIPEKDLEAFIREHKVDEVVFAYSDVSHEQLMHKASRCNAAGADFKLISPANIQLQAKCPLIAVCATRTGCGKSQVSRAAYRWFKDKGYRVVAIREPMPYGELIKQKCMRFAKYEDLDTYACTMEEREEYEPYIEQGLVVYSGVDYEEIVRAAEEEADVIIWDGGNNEVSFYKADLLFCVCDPLRPGDELKYFPGEVNVRAADYFIINKINSATQAQVEEVSKILAETNPSAPCIKTNSEVSCDEKSKELISGKRCVVVEDGPTVTHGNMSYGAGMVAAKKFGGKVVTIPITALKGSMADTFNKFPHLKDVVPAMGYTDQQREDLVATLNGIPKYDTIVNGSPLDLKRLCPGLKKPVCRVTYDIAPAEEGGATLEDHLASFVKSHLAIGEGKPKKKGGASPPKAKGKQAKGVSPKTKSKEKTGKGESKAKVQKTS